MKNVSFGAISASIAALSFSFVFDVAQAQDAVPAAPVSCKVVLENGRVRVVDVQFVQSADKSHSQVGYASRFVRQDVLENEGMRVVDVQFGQSADTSHSQVDYASRFVRQEPSHVTSLGTSVANALLIELKETAK